MEPVIKKTFFLSAGDANAEGELALTELAVKIIEIATEHANSLGIGNPAMEHLNAGWVLSRLTIEMDSFPKVNHHYSLSTWITDFNRHFSTRCFKIENENGETLGYARSIWLVMDAVGRTNLGLSHLNLPLEMIPGEDAPILRQEKHIPILPEKIGSESGRKFLPASYAPVEYTFKYCDIDSYRHVNTVRYIALLLNQFSLSQHDEELISRIELSFLHEAAFGLETLLFRSDSLDNPLSSAFQLSVKEDLSPILFARIRRKKRNENG